MATGSNSSNNQSSRNAESSSRSSSSSFRSQLLQRFKGVCVITVVVTLGLHTYPPLLAFLIVAFIAGQSQHCSSRPLGCGNILHQAGSWIAL
jgi:hypothetical protein